MIGTITWNLEGVPMLATLDQQTERWTVSSTFWAGDSESWDLVRDSVEGVLNDQFVPSLPEWNGPSQGQRGFAAVQAAADYYKGVAEYRHVGTAPVGNVQY